MVWVPTTGCRSWRRDERRDVALTFGRLMTVGDGVFFFRVEVDRRSLDLERNWSGDPTLDDMEEEVFE